MHNHVDILFVLLRAGLGTGKAPDNELLRHESGNLPTDWKQLYKTAAKQGVLAVAWDGLDFLIKNGAVQSGQMPPKGIMMNWAVNVEQIEQRYSKQRDALVHLAGFYGRHGIKLMLLKGYGLSLAYPVPNHRPCGDLDIWLFGKQREADLLLSREMGIKIDVDKHQHTVFFSDGVMVENHFDFFNTHAHPSNNEINKILLKYSYNEKGEEVTFMENDSKISFPSVNFNALFLLRHAASHFAAGEIGLRHLLDWAMFVNRYHTQIDWAAFTEIIKEQNMLGFLNCFNALCVDYLNMDSSVFPVSKRCCTMEQRLLSDILSPEFSEPAPVGKGLLKSLSYKYRRWWANRWKHRMVYKEGLFRTFFVQIWSHIIKPKSLYS